MDPASYRKAPGSLQGIITGFEFSLTDNGSTYIDKQTRQSLASHYFTKQLISDDLDAKADLDIVWTAEARRLTNLCLLLKTVNYFKPFVYQPDFWQAVHKHCRLLPDADQTCWLVNVCVAARVAHLLGLHRDDGHGHSSKPHAPAPPQRDLIPRMSAALADLVDERRSLRIVYDGFVAREDLQMEMAAFTRAQSEWSVEVGTWMRQLMLPRWWTILPPQDLYQPVIVLGDPVADSEGFEDEDEYEEAQTEPEDDEVYLDRGEKTYLGEEEEEEGEDEYYEEYDVQEQEEMNVSEYDSEFVPEEMELDSSGEEDDGSDY